MVREGLPERVMPATSPEGRASKCRDKGAYRRGPAGGFGKHMEGGVAGPEEGGKWGQEAAAEREGGSAGPCGPQATPVLTS